MIVRALARPLLAAVFVTEGLDTLRHPESRVAKAEPVIDLVAKSAQPVAQRAATASEPVVDRATRALDDAAEATTGKVDEVGETLVDTTDAASSLADGASLKAHSATDRVGDATKGVRATVHDVAAGQPLPFQSESYVKANAAVQLGAGVLLATGKLPRLSSFALAATLVPTTLAGHRFWEAEGAERKRQQVHFVKNVSLLGGLILAAVDTEGRPGLAWRAEHLGRDTQVAASAAKVNADLAVRATRANAKAAKRLARANAKAAGKAGQLGVELVGASALRGAKRAAEIARQEAKVARRLAETGAEMAQDKYSELLPQAQARAAELGSHAQALGARGAETAQAKYSELLPQAQALGARVAERLPTPD